MEKQLMLLYHFVLEPCREELLSAAQQHKRGHSQIYFIYLERGGLGVDGGGREKGLFLPGTGCKGRAHMSCCVRLCARELNACSRVTLEDLCASSVSLF